MGEQFHLTLIKSCKERKSFITSSCCFKVRSVHLQGDINYQGKMWDFESGKRALYRLTYKLPQAGENDSYIYVTKRLQNKLNFNKMVALMCYL